jgi:hypothetical protein
MFEVFIPGQRYSGTIDTSAAYRGSFCYISGVDSYGNMKLNVPVSTVQAKYSFYPVNKYYFEEDGNDTGDAIDKLSKGDTVVYYGAGEYGTNKFDASSFGVSIATAVSTVTGGTMYMPGSATANATLGIIKVYVGTAGNGFLYGDTSFAASASTGNPVGFLTGMYYGDSVTQGLMARIRVFDVSNRSANFLTERT